MTITDEGIDSTAQVFADVLDFPDLRLAPRRSDPNDRGALARMGFRDSGDRRRSDLRGNLFWFRVGVCRMDRGVWVRLHGRA